MQSDVTSPRRCHLDDHISASSLPSLSLKWCKKSFLIYIGRTPSRNTEQLPTLSLSLSLDPRLYKYRWQSARGVHYPLVSREGKHFYPRPTIKSHSDSERWELRVGKVNRLRFLSLFVLVHRWKRTVCMSIKRCVDQYARSSAEQIDILLSFSHFPFDFFLRREQLINQKQHDGDITNRSLFRLVELLTAPTASSSSSTLSIDDDNVENPLHTDSSTRHSGDVLFEDCRKSSLRSSKCHWSANACGPMRSLVERGNDSWVSIALSSFWSRSNHRWEQQRRRQWRREIQRRTCHHSSSKT